MGQQIIDAIDADLEPGTLEFYTGTQPEAGAAITDQVLLGVLTFGTPSGIVTDGIVTFNPLTEAQSALANGEVTWGRIKDGAGNIVIDGSAGGLASTAMFRFNSTEIVEGGPIRKSTDSANPFTITIGNA